LREDPMSKKILLSAARSVVQKYKGLRSTFKKSAFDYKSLQKGKQTPRPKKVSTKAIADFFCRDDNSRLAPGKKDAITRKKERVQKRFLNFSIEFLFEKFSSKTNQEVGRSTFNANRPFFVVKPKINDREQCLCIQCANTQVSLITNKEDALWSWRSGEAHGR